METRPVIPTPDGTEIAKFIEDLAAEGERVAVIIGASRLDYVLELLLKSLMKPSNGSSDSLFDNDRPLGSFSAKIALAFRLGFIDSELEQAITIIRKIRNDFSHSMESERLANSPHKERVEQLVKNLRNTEFYDTLYLGYAGKIGERRFCEFCTAMAVILSSLRVLEKLFSEHSDKALLVAMAAFPTGLIRKCGVPPNVINPNPAA